MPPRALKKGFTTGAAAAAAVKAALISFFSKPPKLVEISFLTGEKKQIDIQSVKKITQNQYEALVIKDAGDDPDITHKAQIGARVTLSDANYFQINIIGGKGVGTITKPGLELPVGEPAINPGPRTMIQNSVAEVFTLFNMKNKQVDIEIFVPKGEILAKKTLNARLGIIGGISILGTTGIVTPCPTMPILPPLKQAFQLQRPRVWIRLFLPRADEVNGLPWKSLSLLAKRPLSRQEIFLRHPLIWCC